MRIAILGPAKTGTTAMFYRILASLDGTVFQAFEPQVTLPIARDEPDHYLTKILIGGKGYFDYDLLDSFCKKIAIIRDPRDRLVSSVLYHTFKSPGISDGTSAAKLIALLKKKEASPGSVPFQKIIRMTTRLRHPNAVNIDQVVQRFLARFAKTPAWFYREKTDYTRIRYEDFVEDRLEPLEECLGFKLATRFDIAAQFSRVARTRAAGDWMNWFTEEDVEFLKPVFDGFVTEFGYDTTWQLSSDPKILPEHASGYVGKLVSSTLSERPPASESSKHRRAG